ncbi:MAG: hypothetical protein PHC53_05385 [Patescibacteria group bacterium]|nr:hypothetical protein [Patescibacteria group bacterium]
MPTTWGDIKADFYDAFRDTTTGFIDPEELARMAKRIFRKIDDKLPFAFQETSATLTLTGAASYNLATLFTGFKMLLAIQYGQPGSAARVDLPYISLREFNQYPDAYSYSMKGTSTLVISSPGQQVLTGGTLEVLYYDRRMVQVHGDPNVLSDEIANDDDTFVIPERFLEALEDGLLWLAFRKDRSHREDAIDSQKDFFNDLAQMMQEEPRRVNRTHKYARGAF